MGTYDFYFNPFSITQIVPACLMATLPVQLLPYHSQQLPQPLLQEVPQWILN